jgi:hypothetical protein
MHRFAALVSVAVCWRATARWRFIFAREVSELEEKIDGASSKVVKKHQLTQRLDWNGMSNNTL